MAIMLRAGDGNVYEFSSPQWEFWRKESYSWRDEFYRWEYADAAKLDDSPENLDNIGVSREDCTAYGYGVPLYAKVNLDVLREEFPDSDIDESRGIVPMSKMTEELYERLCSLDGYPLLDDEKVSIAEDEAYRDEFKECWNFGRFLHSVAACLTADEYVDDLEAKLTELDSDEIYDGAELDEVYFMDGGTSPFARDEELIPRVVKYIKTKHSDMIREYWSDEQMLRRYPQLISRLLIDRLYYGGIPGAVNTLRLLRSRKDNLRKHFDRPFSVRDLRAAKQMIGEYLTY